MCVCIRNVDEDVIVTSELTWSPCRRNVLEKALILPRGLIPWKIDQCDDDLYEDEDFCLVTALLDGNIMVHGGGGGTN